MALSLKYSFHQNVLYCILCTMYTKYYTLLHYLILHHTLPHTVSREVCGGSSVPRDLLGGKPAPLSPRFIVHTLLHCTALHCIALHCTTLIYNVLYFNVLNYTALHSIAQSRSHTPVPIAQQYEAVTTLLRVCGSDTNQQTVNVLFNFYLVS